MVMMVSIIITIIIIINNNFAHMRPTLERLPLQRFGACCLTPGTSVTMLFPLCA